MGGSGSRQRPPPPTWGDWAWTAARAVGGVGLTIGREITIAVVSSQLFDYLVTLNPNLDTTQKSHLKTMVNNALRSFLTWDIERSIAVFRAIIALAAPESDMSTVLADFLSVLFGGMNMNVRKADDVRRRNEEEDMAWSRAAADPEQLREARIQLERRHGMARGHVEKLPPAVAIAVYSTLCSGETPVCGITLEDLIDENGRLVSDVVALVHSQTVNVSGEGSGAAPSSRIHVFLYNGEALQEWFSHGHSTDPQTRQSVTERQVFRLSCAPGRPAPAPTGSYTGEGSSRANPPPQPSAPPADGSAMGSRGKEAIIDNEDGWVDLDDDEEDDYPQKPPSAPHQ